MTIFARPSKAAASEGQSLFSTDSAHYKAEVGRALAKTAHEIREPFASEWDVQPHRIAFRGQFRLQVASNSIQHLELESVFAEPAFGRVRPRPLNHGWIVCRNRGIGSRVQEHSRQSQECRIDIAFLLVRDRLRLLVSSLHQPHA